MRRSAGLCCAASRMPQSRPRRAARGTNSTGASTFSQTGGEHNCHHAPMAYGNGRPTLELSDHERGMLRGEGSPATALAMQVIVKMAEVSGAERLIEITSAHIDSCLYHGPVGLDFAQ